MLGLVAFAAHLGLAGDAPRHRRPGALPDVFKSNRDAGLILFAAMLIDAIA